MVDYFDIIRYLKDQPTESDLAAFHEIESRYRSKHIVNYLKFFVQLSVLTLVCTIIFTVGLMVALPWPTFIAVVAEIIGLIVIGWRLASANNDVDDEEYREADKIRERIDARV